MTSNGYYLLALHQIHGLGPITILQLLTRWPVLSDLFRAPKSDLERFGLRPDIIMAIQQFDFKCVDEALAWQAQSQQHHILTWSDEMYPHFLRQLYDPPIVLYAKGALDALDYPLLSMVGTRKPSSTGRETAFQMACELARYDVTIVSGLALGIDGAAHRGALHGHGRTIAVMGTGLGCVYPTSHRQLSEEIIKKGLLLSEFTLKTRPQAGHFPRRNRIISGLSMSTLVVEAASKSGSLITARFALEQNRSVLAIPGSIHNPQASGCHLLLQQGARLVTSCEDILDELGILSSKVTDKKIDVTLASENQDLVKCIGYEVTTIDQIIVRSCLSFDRVACILADLELAGVIESVPGGYMRV